MSRPRTEASTECSHRRITAYLFPGQSIALWACRSCKRRFYPACPTCIDVGHRGIVHPEPVS